MLSVAAARQPQLSSAQGSSWPKSQIPNPFPGISAVTAGRGSRARASLARHKVLLQLQHHTFGSHVGWKCPEGHMGSVAPRDTWISGTVAPRDMWDQWDSGTKGYMGSVAPRDTWHPWDNGMCHHTSVSHGLPKVTSMSWPRAAALILKGIN